MIDELWNLVMSENGFIVNLREYSYFDKTSYKQIKNLLKEIISKYKNKDFFPKKFVLITIELIQHLVGGNNFMTQEQQLELEDASLEIIDILNDIY